MKYCLTVNVTPEAVAKLLLTREMDLTNSMCNIQIGKVWDCLLSMNPEDILHVIDCNKLSNIANVKYIPQFGKLETLRKVPYYFFDTGNVCADYSQLGFYLKHDLSSSLGANVKFGENHGKGASLLGIVNCVETKIVPSILTDSFCQLSLEEQEKILIVLLFRVPIIQILLQNAKNRSISVYEPLILLSESTQRRRAQCIKAILKIIRTLNSKEINERLDNIIF